MLSRSALYRNLLAYQVYGANTEVGKTIFSTILCKAFARKHKTWYLKPVSTGPDSEADDGHLKRFAKGVETKCLFQFDEAVSPHIAAAAEPPADSVIVDGVLRYLDDCASVGQGAVLVESAGGVHSPTPTGTSQVDLYRPLRLPIFMVADSKLGGISSTISAFESLHLRGYDLDSVFCFENKKYRNHEFLSDYFGKKQIHHVSIAPPPARLEDVTEEMQSMSAYYESMVKSDAIQEVIETAAIRHQKRLDRLEQLPTKAVQSIWYPFTQHKDLSSEKILTIDSAHGDFFQTSQQSPGSQAVLQPTFDASASWWTQGLGHGSPDLSLAASYAAGRYGHVMFAGAVHEPAIALADLLLSRLGNPRLKKVFYSDNGSTGMEVAIKMALNASAKRYNFSRATQASIGIIGLKGSYHGDTIGTMDASEPCTYNENVHWYEGKGHWFDFPKVVMRKGAWVVETPEDMLTKDNESFSHLNEIFDSSRDESAAKETYEKYIISGLQRLSAEGREFGALVMEPLILGAGGMQFCDPLFQRTLVQVVRTRPDVFTTADVTTIETPDPSSTSWSGLPVIFDEVFTGLFRLGTFTPSTLLNTHPDISVHAKLLTGGLLPLCTTVASDSIYESFIGDTKAEALLHGHSYTAHAIGCEVARSSLQSILDLDSSGAYSAYKKDWTQSESQLSAETSSTPKAVTADRKHELWSSWSHTFVSRISHSKDVDSVIALGTVLAITLKDESGSGGYSSDVTVGLQRELLAGRGDEKFNIHSRTLGNVIYIMASLVSEKKSLASIEARLLSILEG